MKNHWDKTLQNSPVEKTPQPFVQPVEEISHPVLEKGLQFPQKLSYLPKNKYDIIFSFSYFYLFNIMNYNS